MVHTGHGVPAPCLLNALSITGLRRLQSTRADWAIVVAQHLPESPELTAELSVKDALAGGVLDLHALQRLGAHAFRRHRQSARYAAAVAGHVQLGHLGDAVLQQARVELERLELAPATITRVLGLLRRLARAWAAEAGQEPHVTSRPTRASSKTTEPHQVPLWTPKQIAQLLAATLDRGVRVAVGLAVGCGLAPGEVRHVHVEDLDLQRHLVAVRNKHARVMPMPPWVEDLIRDHLSAWQGHGAPQSPWLLPAPRDPRRARGDLSGPLRAAQQHAGLGDLPRISMRILRRTWQWAALHAGLPRAAMRGSWSMAHGGAPPPWWPQLVRHARKDWRTLTGLDPRRFPRDGTMTRTRDGLLPAWIVEARRARPTIPPPLPASAAQSVD
jgi:integrase